MSAEKLREAASKMRELAEAVDYPSPWEVGSGTCGIRSNGGRNYVASTYGGVGHEEATAAHIAGMHPAVALAVADWLGTTAERHRASESPVGLFLHMDEPCEACANDGHELIVCDGCYPAWDGMEAHTVYPCREAESALAVARAYLGES